MEIGLVSELGARLPRGGGLLGFGATEADARRRLESLGRPALAVAPFGRGGGGGGGGGGRGGGSWGWRARVGDRWVEASAGGDGLLGEIRVARAIGVVVDDVVGVVGAAGAVVVDGAAGASGIPVLYRGIDLFDHSMAEVEFLLGATGGGGVRDLRLTGISGYAQSVTLLDLTRPYSSSG